MAQFSAAQRGVAGTASNTQLNNGTWTLLTAGLMAKAKMINWGGSDTSLVSYSTRWARVTSTPTTPTALAVTPTSPGTTAIATYNTYAGTASAGATSPAGLFQEDWNSQGGGGVVVFPIGGEWFIVGGAVPQTYNQIGCGNVVGASANTSFGITWEE